jgi:predicted aldo/keto reductase-like oxidoreductase
MAKRKGTQQDPEDEGRRRVVKGGLLAMASALGFWPAPGCSNDGKTDSSGGAGDGAGPGTGGSTAIGSGGASPLGSGGATSSGMTAQSGSGTGGATTGSGGTTPPGGGTSTKDAGAATDSGTGMLADASQPGSMTLPRGTLGKTGIEIPIIGVGTSRLGERGGTPNDTDYANMLKVFGQAMDMGIEYWDTGANYGRAEEALGELIPQRRDKIVLATKLYTDTRDEAQTLFERSLERLQTDYVDILHLHATGDRNIDTVLSDSGSWGYILEQKAMGRARFVGITGHNNPPNFIRMIETDTVDVLMTIMNFVDHSTYGLSKDVREAAVSRNMGVMAMKIFGGTESVFAPGLGLANTAAPEPHKSNMELSFDISVLPDCMRFVKTLPGVTGMVIGINFIEELEQNMKWAMETEPFSDDEMAAIVKMGETMAETWKDRYG